MQTLAANSMLSLSHAGSSRLKLAKQYYTGHLSGPNKQNKRVYNLSIWGLSSWLQLRGDLIIQHNFSFFGAQAYREVAQVKGMAGLDR